VVFKTIQVLVALAAYVAFVRLFFFHAHCTGIWCGCLRIDNGECSICVIMQSLVVVAVLKFKSEDDR